MFCVYFRFLTTHEDHMTSAQRNTISAFTAVPAATLEQIKFFLQLFCGS